MRKLTTELRLLLLKLAKRNDVGHGIWFNCSLTPNRGDSWECYICQKEFIFKESLLEVDEHGFQHLEDKNLLVFI